MIIITNNTNTNNNNNNNNNNKIYIQETNTKNSFYNISVPLRNLHCKFIF